jgi:hypothetical protein
MKGLIRGVAGTALVLGATACAEDFSIDFGGAPTAVQASPEVMFLASGTQKEILVRLVNDRNQSTPTSFDLANVGAGLTVTYDDQYRPEWTSRDTALVAPLVKEQQRYTVSANIPTGGQRTFQFTSGGLAGTVKVNVTPTVIGLQGGPGGLMEVATVTAPGFIFREDFGIAFGELAAEVISVAEDGSSAEVRFPANQSSTPTITNVAVSFLPTVTLASIQNVEVITTATTPYGGSSPTDNPAVITYAGGTQVFRDSWVNFGDPTIVGGGQEKIWRLVLPAGGTRTISLDWNADAAGEDGDYDFAVCTVADPSICPIARLTGAHPEIGTANLPAGEYYVAVVLFNDIHPAGVLTLTIE